MRRTLWLSMLLILPGLLTAQNANIRMDKAARTIVEGQLATLQLAPHLMTTIRLPEPVNSVIVGDSSLFHAEYSPNEPLLVFAKPITAAVAESNLVISTTQGRLFVLSLRSVGSLAAEAISGVDLIVDCRPADILFIGETFPSERISETLANAAAPDMGAGRPDFNAAAADPFQLDDLVGRQGQQPLRNLHGDRIRVGIGPVLEHGSRLIVSFSVVNPGVETIELVPPQVQMAGQTKSGLFRRTRWNTVLQLPVDVYRIQERRIAPRGRVDGVVVFERPSMKQSTEGLFLQIADTAAIDEPTLAPISFRATNLNGGNHE